jgi:hypothetical protein
LQVQYQSGKEDRKEFSIPLGMETEKINESLKDPSSRLSEILFGRRLYSYFSSSKVPFRELENFIFFKLGLIPKKWSLIDSPIIKRRILPFTLGENTRILFDEGFSLMIKNNYRLIEEREEMKLPDLNFMLIDSFLPLKEKSDLDFIKKVKKEMKVDKGMEEYNRWVNTEIRDTDQMRELTNKGFSEQKSAFLLWVLSQPEEKKEEEKKDGETEDNLGIDLLW